MDLKRKGAGFNFYQFLYILQIISSFRGDNYGSFQTELSCTTGYAIHYPENMHQVQRIVQEGIRLKIRVKAIGSRHSVLDSICTDGIPIDMHKIAYTVIEPDSGIARVGAGTELADFVATLERNGRALDGHVPSFGGITIGGALGTGARGSSLLHPTSLSDQIISIVFVTGGGEIATLDENSPDFNAFRVHLGLVGIVTEVTFKTVASYKMKIENYKVDDSILLSGKILKMARTYDWLELHWFPNTNSVVISKGTFVGSNQVGNASTYRIPNLNKLTALGMRTGIEAAQATNSKATLAILEIVAQESLLRQLPFRSPIFSEDGGHTMKNPATGYVHNLMQNRCTNCAWEFGSLSLNIHPTGFGLPIEQFEGMVKSVREILVESPAYFPIIGIFIRFAPKSNGFMSVENGRETVHIEIVTPMRTDPLRTARTGLAAIQAIEQAMVFHHQGRTHFSMSGLAFHSIEMEERNSAGIWKFREMVTKYDPNGIFMNEFGMRIMGVRVAGKTSKLVGKVDHCALQEHCICKLDQDCAQGQRCEQLRGFNVCKDSGNLRKTLGSLFNITNFLKHLTRVN